MIFYFHRSPKRQQDFSQNPESEEVHFEIVIPSELGQLGKKNAKSIFVLAKITTFFLKGPELSLKKEKILFQTSSH